MIDFSDHGDAKGKEEFEKDEDDIEKLQFKVILLGDGAVGKTSIAMRFSEDQFSQNYKQTVGVDFHIRRLMIPPKYHIAMQIWDIGGQSIGSKMVSNYIAGSHAILLCYDITNYESFLNLEDWYRIVVSTFKFEKLPQIVLVGNKSDLRHLTAVKPDLHNKFAEENKMSSFFMSARNGDQVLYAFTRLAASLAGVPLTKIEEIQHTVLPAQIINSERHDKSVNDGKVPEYVKRKNYGCIIS